VVIRVVVVGTMVIRTVIIRESSGGFIGVIRVDSPRSIAATG